MEKNSSDSANRLPSRVPAVELEAHHRSEVVHLSFGQRMLRVGLEPRIEDAFHSRVFREEAAHRGRVGALPLVAQKISPHSALDQERRVRIERRTQRHDVLAHAFDQLPAAR